MATRYGKAQYRPLSVRQTQPAMSRHDIVCLHTMVGFLRSTEAMFRRQGYGGTESHYGIGGKWGSDSAVPNRDGVVYQWQDRAYTADANFEGNDRVISIETADNAPRDADDLAGWTPPQIEAIIELIAWECSLEAHAQCPKSWACHTGVLWSGVRVAIPPVLIPDTKSTRRGLAVHRQGVEPAVGVGRLPGYLVAGGERWSTGTGKECPGDRRVQQFKEIVIPAVQSQIRAAAPTKEKPMSELTVAQLEASIIKVLKEAKIVPNPPTAAQLKADPKAKPTMWSVVDALSNVETNDDNDRNTDKASVAEVKAMLVALMAAHGVSLPE